jgi:hypothetical protein
VLNYAMENNMILFSCGIVVMDMSGFFLCNTLLRFICVMRRHHLSQSVLARWNLSSPCTNSDSTVNVPHYLSQPIRRKSHAEVVMLPSPPIIELG